MAAGDNLEFLKMLNSENWSSCQKLDPQTLLQESSVKKAISVANGFG